MHIEKEGKFLRENGALVKGLLMHTNNVRTKVLQIS